MATWLKQSTATTVELGPFVDSGDGFTVEDGLTISQADVRLSKNGGAFAQVNESTAAAHMENGWYSKALNTTDTGTLGRLRIAVNESGALPVWLEFMVLPANVYDSLVAGSDTLNADVTQFGGTNGTFSGGRPEVNTTHAAGTAWASGAITAASIAADAITAAKIADNAIDAGAIASDAITAAKIATGAITAAKFAAGAIDAAALAADAGTEIATAVWAAGTRTLTAGTNIDGSTFTAIPWNASWDAEVQSEVNDALVANNLDHLVLSAVDTDFATTVHANSVIGHLADNGAGFDRTTDSLEAIRDRGDAAWTTATGFSTHSAADVWAVATRVLTAGTNIVLAKGTGVTGFNDLSAADVNSEVDTAIADARLDELLAADSDIDGAAPPAVGSVFHELMTKTTGSFTYDQTTDSLEALRDRGDAAWTTATGFSTHSAADVWAVATRVLTAGTNIVLAKGTGVTGFNDLSAAQVNAEADTALADVGLTTTITGRIDAAITSRMATYTQPTGFLAATFPTTVASTTNITAGTITTATNVTTVNGLAANVITAAALATDAATEIAGAIESALINEGDGNAVLEAIRLKIEESDDDLTTGAIAVAVRDAILDRVLAGNHDTTGTAGKLLQSITEARLAELDAANLPADVAAVHAKTTNLPGDPADASDIAAAIAGLNDLSSAEVQTAAAAALAAYDPPTKAELDSAAALLATSAQLVKVLAAVYDTVSRSGDVLTLSNGATQTISSGGRTTAGG